MADRTISILILIFSIFYIIATLKLSGPDLGEPVGSKGFPLFVAFSLILSSLILFLRSFKSIYPQRNTSIGEFRTNKRNLFFVTLAIIGYIFILSFAGYTASTFLFLITVLMLWNNKGKWYVNSTIALIAAVAFYFMISILNISLPVGRFGLP